MTIARIAAAVLLVALVAGWGWWAIHRRRLSAVPGMLLALALPFTIPTAWLWPRIIATVLGITLAGKSWALGRSGPLDARMLGAWPLYLFWLLMPPESRAPTDDDEARRTRARGRARCLRALAKLPFVGLLLWIHVALPRLHDNAWVEACWALWLVWLAMSATTDLASGLGMQTGIAVAETFDTPPFARSPRDFWARRWNLYVAHYLARHVFAQVGGRRHPLRATAIVFLGSGVFHEFFMFCCLGRFGPHTGWMLAFFAIHGAAVMLEMAIFRRGKSLPRAAAIALHFAWLLATAPLFFGPLGELLG